MKRLLCLVFLLLLAALPAWAETEADALVALLSAHPQAVVAEARQWGDTVAALLEEGGKPWLCLLERQDGRWSLTVDNDKALLPGEDLPQLLLDSDSAIFWTYPGEPTRVFSCFREADGAWGLVSQTVRETLGNGEVWERQLYWKDAPGGGLWMRSRTLWDENENQLSGVEDDGFPAPWLADCVKLATFDAGRLPLYEPEEYTGQWPNQAFMQDAAARLMPAYAYVGGAYMDNMLQFLMDKPDGTRIFVGYARNGFEPALCESVPLPAGTCYGVENFTTSLGVGSLCVDIGGSFRSPLLGVRMVMSGGEQLMLGSICVYSAYDPERVCIGDHPWQNIESIDWDTLPKTFEAAVSSMDGSKWAVVNNPNPADRLHLRTRPDKGAPSLGKYYNGTPAHVWEERGDWVNVEVFGQSGWMLKKYLSFQLPHVVSFSAMPTLQIKGVSAALYDQPDARADSEPLYNDTGMRVIGVIEDEWVHVWFPLSNRFGFIRRSELWEGNG